MKRILFALLMVLLVASFGPMVTPPVSALDAPQPWMFPAVQFSKLGSVDAVQQSFMKYQGDYAAAHDGCWGPCYEAVVTEWMHANGCVTCYLKDNVLSPKIVIDLPNYNQFPTTLTTVTPDWMYGMIQASGMTIDNIRSNFYASQVAYATVHSGCWDACYEAVVTEWMNSHGCSNCYLMNNQMSFKPYIDKMSRMP